MARKYKKGRIIKVYAAALKRKQPLFLRDEERDFGGHIKMKYKVIVTEEESFGQMYHPRLFAWEPND